MKKILVLLFCCVAHYSFSQTYFDKIVEESCACISKVSDNLDKERYTQEIGICMLVAAEPYRKQLKKEHGINFDKIDVDGEKLGRLIGMKMATMCPNAILSAVNKSDESSTASAGGKSFGGTVTKLENDFFVILHVKEESGKINKFYWLTYVESDVDLADQYASMIGSPVNITYRSEDMFDPKIKEYRQFSIIEKIEFTNR